MQQAETRSRFRPRAGSVSGTGGDVGSRQTCSAAASRLELQMCQVRERKGHGDSSWNTGTNASRNKEQRCWAPA